MELVQKQLVNRISDSEQAYIKRITDQMKELQDRLNKFTDYLAFEYELVQGDSLDAEGNIVRGKKESINENPA